MKLYVRVSTSIRKIRYFHKHSLQSVGSNIQLRFVCYHIMQIMW